MRVLYAALAVGWLAGLATEAFLALLMFRLL